MIDCPTCGRAIAMGLPQDATVESVTPIRDDGEGTDHDKTRSVECGNGHSILVKFSKQRDIAALTRKLTYVDRDPLNFPD